MILLTRARDERPQDRKRKRALIIIGRRGWRLTPAEVRQLRRQAGRYLREVAA